MEQLKEALRCNLCDDELGRSVVDVCEQLVADPLGCLNIISLADVNKHVAGSLLERWIHRHLETCSSELQSEILQVLLVFVDEMVMCRYVCDALADMVRDEVIEAPTVFSYIVDKWLAEMNADIALPLSRLFLRVLEKSCIQPDGVEAILAHCSDLWNETIFKSSKLVSRVLKIVSVVDSMCKLRDDVIGSFLNRCLGACVSGGCDADVVYYCCRFLKVMLCRKRELTEYIQQFCAFLVSNVCRFSECDRVQLEMLRSIDRFCLNDGLLELLLNCARLSDEDKMLFDDNPAMFVANVCSRSHAGKIAPRIYSLLLIESLVARNDCLRFKLLELRPEEVTIRLFALLSKHYLKNDIQHQFIGWVNAALKCPCQSAHEMATRLYFLRKIDAPDEVKCAFLEQYFTPQAHMVVLLCCCKLLPSLKALSVPPFMARLISFLPHCPTIHAYQCLTRLAQRVPSAISSYSGAVLQSILFDLQRCLDAEPFESEEVQEDMKTITIFAQVNHALPLAELILMIERCLSVTTDCDCQIAKLCQALILHQESVDPNLILVILRSMELDQFRISVFSKVFMALISRFQDSFLSLNISQGLISSVLALGNDITLKNLDLIAFVLQIDRSIDASKILSLLPNPDSLHEHPDLQLGIANIVATLMYTRSIPVHPILLWIIEQGYCARSYDKCLAIAALRQCGQTDLIRTVEHSPQSPLPAALMFLKDYRFPAPVQVQFPLSSAHSSPA